MAVIAARGLFGEALNALSQVPSSRLSASDQVLRLELLERTGRGRDAASALGQVRKLKTLTNTEQARCAIVEGLLAKHRGHFRDSSNAFQLACQIAETSGLQEQLCWAQLRLLGVLGEATSEDTVERLHADLRCNVDRAGIPAVSVAFHVFTAEAEAKRGHIAVSRHHAEAAASVLQVFPNAWLRGLLELHQSCLSYLEGDFLGAIRLAVNALDGSAQSGHAHTRVSALADLAAAYLALGQSARARACLGRALEITDPEEQIFGLLLESLAEAHLAERNVDGCEESLRKAQSIETALSQSRSSWHRAWNLRTRVRLLHRRGEWAESIRLLRESRALSPATQESATTSQIAVLEALGIVRSGVKAKIPSAIIDLALAMADEAPLLQGMIHATAAFFVAHEGAPKQSVPLFERAIRLLATMGEASNLVETVDHFIPILGTLSAVETGSAPPIRSLWRPTRVVCHLSRSTSVTSPPTPTERELVAFFGSLPGLEREPKSIGEEALRIVSAFGWIRSGRVIAESSSGPTEVVADYGDDTIRSLKTKGSSTAGIIEVDLGTKNGRDYRFLLIPKDSPETLLSCVSTARLLRALIASRSKSDGTRLGSLTVGIPAEPDQSIGVFSAPSMMAMVAVARRVAPLNLTVLLTGESGTGKEVMAHVVHEASRNPSAPFVPFNCATIPRDMLDSQLFGYRRGAFTGATDAFTGVIEAAEGGTLFLDEIGDLPLETQPKLLRFLDSMEVQPLGEAIPHRVNVRVIAATNADLNRLVQEGKFRQDLYFRLDVVHLRLPPLRERREEIRPLALRFLASFSREFGRGNLRLSDETMEHLLLRSWPGNVRELCHEIRRVVAFSEPGATIRPCDLRPQLGELFVATTAPACPSPNMVAVQIDRPLSEIADEIERAALRFVLDAENGHMDLAAKRLGLSRKGLYLKRRRLGLMT